jgi:hypothetical protein
MSAGDRAICYWDASTRTLIARQEIDVPDKYISREDHCVYEMGQYKKYLSFSADGTLLAAVYPNQIVISHVPFFIAHENQYIFILWCLKNYRCNGDLLIQDVIRVLCQQLKNL